LRGGGAAATRPLPRDGGVEELHGHPIVGAMPQGLERGLQIGLDVHCPEFAIAKL